LGLHWKAPQRIVGDLETEPLAVDWGFNKCPLGTGLLHDFVHCRQIVVPVIHCSSVRKTVIHKNLCFSCELLSQRLLLPLLSGESKPLVIIEGTHISEDGTNEEVQNNVVGKYEKGKNEGHPPKGVLLGSHTII
jgi:hypothetical protein